MQKLDIEYGCECSSNCLVHSEQGYDAKKAPCVKLVERDNKIIKVCSRCTLDGSDILIKWLINKKTPAKPLFDYDPFIISYGDEIPN